jgi:hypothetical protein
MSYLNFISDEDLKNHIKKTLSTYSDTIKSINLDKFNSNLIDPIKLTFDSNVYNKDMETIVKEEIARQRDKTNTNAIGYFHQNIFKYFNNCEVPEHGFDIIFTKPNGNKVYVELKNKHNTMNSSSSQKTYAKLSSKALEEPSCECFLVEIIARKSQNIAWYISLDGQRVGNEKVRRVSIDKFYEIVTGEKDAFAKLCKVLPNIINEIVSQNEQLSVEEDTVIKELREKDSNLLKALYLLAFSTYEGFDSF